MKPPKLLKSLLHSNILGLSADSNYTYLFTAKGKKHVSAYSLKVYQELLPSSAFIRLNRSNLVNLAFIRSFDNKENGIDVHMINDRVIKVSRRRKAKVLKTLQAINFKPLSL